MVNKKHQCEYYTCNECGWEGECSELTEDGECPKCYAILEEELEDSED